MRDCAPREGMFVNVETFHILSSFPNILKKVEKTLSFET